MDGYITKPFRPHELFKMVEDYAVIDTGNERAAAPPRDAALSPSVTATPAAPAVNLVEFYRAMREAGAEDAVESILGLFAGDAPNRLAAFTAAVAAGDTTRIQRAAHAFKSPAGSIGANGLQALLQEAELAAMAGDMAGVGAVCERVGPEVDAVLAYLNQPRGKEVTNA
jgi:HPt (histidine-containing phosphotransfer) domain-containing protein